MEAASVPAAGSDAGGEGAEGAPQSTFDAEAAFGELRGGLHELHQSVRSLAPPPAEPEPDPEPELDLSWLGEIEGELQHDPEARAQAQQRMLESLAPVVDARVEQRVQGIEQRFEQREKADAAVSFLNEFPEFKEEGGQQRVEEVVGLAGAIAAREVGQRDPQLANELASSPWFWGIVYRATRAPTPGQSGSAPGGIGGAAHLEGGGGPRPSVPEVDPGQMIVDDQPRKVLPF